MLSSEEEEEGQDDGDGGKLQSSGWAEESGNSEQIQVGETPETDTTRKTTKQSCLSFQELLFQKEKRGGQETERTELTGSDGCSFESEI